MRLSRRTTNLLFPLLLLVATVIAYRPAIEAGFIWDDDAYLTENPVYTYPNPLPKIWQVSPVETPQYYPLVFTSFYFEKQIWGLNPMGYHLVNVLLHAGSALLLWRVLRRLKVPGALFAAAVVALHPMMAESVAWVTERKNTFSGFFFLASLLTFLQFIWPVRRKNTPAADADAPAAHAGLGPAPEPDAPHAPARPWHLYAASLLLYILALLSKTVACGLAPVLVLILWWKRRPAREYLLTLPWWILGLVGGLFTAYLERIHVGARGEALDISFVDKVLLAGRVVAFYAGKLLFPAELSFYYTRWQISAGAWWQWLFPLLVLGALAGLIAARKKIGRAPFVAAAAFLVLLFPAMGFFPVFPMIFSWVADHFAYHAALAFIPLVCAALALLARRFLPGKPEWRIGLAMLLLLPLLIKTYAVAGTYKSNETLFRAVLAYNDRRGEPRHWNALSLVSRALVDQADELARLGRRDEAAAKRDEAFALDQESLKNRPGYASALNNIAAYYLFKKDLPKALDFAQQAVKADPMDHRILLTVSSVYRDMGDLDKAIDFAIQAVKAQPRNARSHIRVARLALQKGDANRARLYIANAEFVDPNNGEAYLLHGHMLARQNQLRPALDAFRKAAELDPGNLEALNAFARQAANMLDASPADMELAAIYNKFTVETTAAANADYLDTFGMLLARRGYPVEALSVWRDALARVQPDEPQVREAILRHIAFVERGMAQAASGPASQPATGPAASRSGLAPTTGSAPAVTGPAPRGNIPAPR